MTTDPIINGLFDGTDTGWSFEGPSAMSITDPDWSAPGWTAYINYRGECAIERGSRIKQTITIPNVDGDILLNFREKTNLNYWAGSCGIMLGDSWLYKIYYGTSGRRTITTEWAEHSISISKFKGQTLELAIVWWDIDTINCSMYDHNGWIWVDDLKMIFSAEISHAIEILSNPTFAIMKVDGQII